MFVEKVRGDDLDVAEAGIIELAKSRDWRSFLDPELAERKDLKWPPFTRLAKVSFAGPDGRKVALSARTGADRLRRAAADLGFTGSVQVLGPTPALVERSGGRWTHNIIIKSSLAAEKLGAVLAHIGPGATIDIDPRSIA